jgi:hypothetical protein
MLLRLDRYDNNAVEEVVDAKVMKMLVALDYTQRLMPQQMPSKDIHYYQVKKLNDNYHLKMDNLAMIYVCGVGY